MANKLIVKIVSTTLNIIPILVSIWKFASSTFSVSENANSGLFHEAANT